MSLAPELSPALEWLNSPPLTLAQQRGRVVALAFFSAGSAYCQNLLDDLRALQGKHADGLQVIGVHSPKFEAERQSRLALKTINRLGVRFPVAHDPAFIAWQHYGIRAWPALALLDAAGHLVQVIHGDLQRETMDRRITAIIDQTPASDRIFTPVQPVSRPEPRGALHFPTGLALSASHLYVADSGHHRILECTHDGRILRQFGSGNAGFIDGAGGECSFQSPHGLWVAKDLLYIADTGNHALRRVKLLTGEVETLAGTGKAGLIAQRGPVDAREQPLNLPCGLAGSTDKLYIAMTGANQVWEFDLVRRQLSVLAGAGRLGLGDGPTPTALFGQPSGIALVQQTLYVSDAAGSSIRSISLGGGMVQTLIGQGLFAWGSQDGTRSSAQLQYPLGLALDPRAPQLWIVDSYNCALRHLRLGGGELRRFDLDYRLAEPSAVCAAPGTLWVSNTNAHEVLRIDVDAGTAKRLPIGE